MTKPKLTERESILYTAILIFFLLGVGIGSQL
jgi:hypothetical protein